MSSLVSTSALTPVSEKFVPNEQQAEAADKFLHWWDYERWDRDFHIQGLAGTGKTALFQYLQTLIRASTLYMAPTGKAARVVSHRVKKTATTIHKFMYRPVAQESDEIRERMGELHTGKVFDPDGGWLTEEQINAEMDFLRDRLMELKKGGDSAKFSFKAPEEDAADLLCIDEYSMIGSRMGADFANVRIPKVFTGDPGQLEPVKDTWAYAHVKPDVFLTKLMRTGAGSGVAKAAMDVREKRRLQAYGQDFTLNKRGVIQLGQYPEYDMILVGKNEIRKKINKMFRGLLGYQDKLLVEGEKLMALNNQENGISNGELLTVERIITEIGNLFICDLRDAYGNFFPVVEIWKGTLRHDEGQFECPRSVGQFCYGYAITVHKSQGSEGKRVLLLNSWGEDRPDYHRWLYTGITRASERCDFVV